MRRSRFIGAIVLAALGAAAGGCGTPVLTINHGWLTDLGLPGRLDIASAEPFTVVSGPEDGFGPFMRDALAERCRPPASGGPAEDAVRVALTGTLAIDLRDARGRRTVERRSRETGAPEPVQIETLRRTASVRAVLNVRDAATGGTIASAEVARDYDSVGDPAVYGPHGLGRPDDPERVPPGPTIVRELLSSCAEALARMMTPVRVRAKVRLREASSVTGRRGLGAAAKGDYAAAAACFMDALAAAPADADLRFNLAAVQEAAGNLDAALAHYEAAAGRAGGDPEAAEAVRRIKQVLAARARPAQRLPAAIGGPVAWRPERGGAPPVYRRSFAART